MGGERLLTHERLVELIEVSNDRWTCLDADAEICTHSHNCEGCAESLATAYEDSIRADGVEEGKKQTTLAKLDIDEQYEVSNRIEAEIRADERQKVLDEVYRIITNQMIKHGTELGFNLETQELILQLKEGGENANQ